jgi:DNA gyrase subunit A
MLRHTEYITEERYAYLKRSKAERGGEEAIEAAEPANGDEGAEAATEMQLSDERYAEMKKNEEFILSVAEDGFGKLTSAYEYRITGRGGKGIGNIMLDRPKAAASRCIAAFPATDEDQLLLVTQQGQIIRTPVDGIRTAGRSTRGVVIFRLEDGDKVVSVSRLREED